MKRCSFCSMQIDGGTVVAHIKRKRERIALGMGKSELLYFHLGCYNLWEDLIYKPFIQSLRGK